MGQVVRLAGQLDAACFMLKQLVCRENGSSDVDLSVRVQHALVEVDVCVAPEPLRLHEGSSRVCTMMVACPVVGTVAAGCAWARFTAFPVSLQSDHRFSFFRPFSACPSTIMTKPVYYYDQTLVTHLIQSQDRPPCLITRILPSRRHAPQEPREFLTITPTLSSRPLSLAQ